MWGDQAYRGQRAVIREHAPKARDFTNRRYRHRGVVDEVERAKNRTKSKVRARVEHAIGVIKRVFGFAEVRYRGLKKNTHRLLVTCARRDRLSGSERESATGIVNSVFVLERAQVLEHRLPNIGKCHFSA
jgi:IS5 family transposase